ncbi:MAG: class I adenylate-forming enzyme family protein [Aggregatilineales bacterium]
MPERTLIQLVHDACLRDPDSAAMIFEDGLVVTRRDLLDRAERFAGYLATRLKRAESVAIMLENRAEFMIAWLAVVANRAILVSIDPDAKEHDLAHMLKDSGATFVIAGSAQRQALESVLSKQVEVREVLYVLEAEPDGLRMPTRQSDRLSFAATQCERTDITNVYYTSGTTGLPKGCLVDHEWWLRTSDLNLRLDSIRHPDRLFCCLQFFYPDSGSLLLTSLKSGCPLVIARRFSVSRFWSVVRQYHVTIIAGIGAMPVLLLKAPPSPGDRRHSVTRAYQMGIPPQLHRALAQRFGFPWLETYGATEGNMLARMPLALAEEMVGSGSIGVAVPEVSLRLVDNQGADVALGEVGEILAKGPGMMRGYVGSAAGDREAKSGAGLRTGDLAHQDEHGFLYFAGRNKDIIRRSGENVSATEVENVLRLHPRIVDAAVVPVPDEIRGEEIKAYVLLPDLESQQNLPPDEIVQFCSERLAAHKIPRYIEYRTSDFVRTTTMRIRKDVLKAEREDLLAGVWDRQARAATPTGPGHGGFPPTVSHKL